jgi:hypothetical protein
MKQAILTILLIFAILIGKAQFKQDSSSLTVDRKIFLVIKGDRIEKTIAYLFVKNTGQVVGGRAGKFKYPLVNLDEVSFNHLDRCVLMFTDGTWADGAEINLYYKPNHGQ